MSPVSGQGDFMKALFVLCALVMLGTALVGCKASAEVGDTASNVSVPR
jgi:hypothetical protein